MEEIKSHYPHLYIEDVFVGGDFKALWYKAWDREEWPRCLIGCGWSLEELKKDCLMTIERRSIGH